MNNQFAGMKAKLLGISLSMVTFVVSIGSFQFSFEIS